jgi:hypothetical protein
VYGGVRGCTFIIFMSFMVCKGCVLYTQMCHKHVPCTGANDRDATVRARALAHFAASADLLWSHDLDVAAHPCIILGYVVPTLCCRCGCWDGYGKY